MKFTEPADGASVPVSHPVAFNGEAGPSVATISLIADGQFDIGSSDVANGQWAVVRQFSAPGSRLITARALDAAGALLQEQSITIRLADAHSLGYNPPASTRPVLGGILDLVEQGERLTPDLQGLEFMCKLPGGELFFQSDLDLDTDGKKESGIVYEPTHQSQTSIDSSGSTVSSNSTPYFVLPGGFFGQFGIKLGDVAAVLFQDKIEYAVLADTGPRTKIGEGSIALHRSLGFERIRSNGHIIDVGIDGGVVTLVFPGSGNGKPQTPDAIRSIGKARFKDLGGSV